MQPHSGQILSHYRLVERVGEGGMGVVWKAEDTVLGRTVAIKVLPSDLARDERRRGMFLEEARLASSLSEAHIVQTYDFCREGDLQFIVMEFVEGEALSRVLQGRALPSEKVTRLGHQVARALSRAHRKGLLHLDLKPSNILVTVDGDAKVVDFGLARLLSRGDSWSEGSGVATDEWSTEITKDKTTDRPRVAGTLPYMSPEQVSGERLDARTDIFSLGVVLFEMTSGKRPFNGDSDIELIQEIRRARQTPIHELVPKVPMDLERIIQKTLARHPRDRYQTMEDLAVDLRRLNRDLASGSSPSYDSISVAPAPDRRRWRMALLAGTAAVVLLALAWIGALQHKDRFASMSAQPGTEGPSSIAVLPLRNISGDPEEGYFVDGITEELITHIAKIRSLRVTSVSSVMQYKEDRPPLVELAARLDVDSIVEGSVLRLGDRVRISARLIDAGSDKTLWAESYERSFSDLLFLQSEVARAIAEEIRGQLTAYEQASLEVDRQVDPEAYEEYFRGRYYSSKYTMKPEVGKSMEHFKRAIDLDPTFPLAYAGLAHTYYMGSNLFTDPAVAMPSARAAALRALELDPELAEANAALALVEATYDWDWQRAENHYRRAIELNPSYAFARYYFAYLLMTLGQTDEAIEQMDQAQRLDPLAYYIQAGVPFLLFLDERYEEVIDLSTKAIEQEPDAPAGHAFLGMAHERMGQYIEAIRALDTAVRAGPELTENQAWLAHAHAVSGDLAEARRILRNLESLQETQFISAYSLAMIHIGLGETDAAFELFLRACRDRAEWAALFKADPRLFHLRGEPGYKAMLECVGLPR